MRFVVSTRVYDRKVVLETDRQLVDYNLRDIQEQENAGERVYISPKPLYVKGLVLLTRNRNNLARSDISAMTYQYVKPHTISKKDVTYTGGMMSAESMPGGRQLDPSKS